MLVDERVFVGGRDRRDVVVEGEVAGESRKEQRGESSLVRC